MRNRTFFVFLVFVLLLISGSIASKLWKHPFQALETTLPDFGSETLKVPTPSRGTFFAVSLHLMYPLHLL